MGEAVKKDDEETLIPVGPGADEPEPKEKDEEEPQDERLAQKADDADEQDEKPERKRESAKERRERAKKAHARDRLERDFLLKRNEELEKRFASLDGRMAQNETAAIDQRMNTLNSQIANADRVMADAMRKPNGSGAEDFIEAQRIRDQLRDQLAELTVSKKTHQQYTQQAQQRVQQREPEGAKPDPRVLRNAREWASRHDWFAFDGNDEDSTIVRGIDEVLASEGYDPTSEEYWDELTARVKRRLPEHFRKGARADDDDDALDDDDEKPRQKQGPKFSSGGRERPLKKGEVYVSAERKQAMKEYGVWEDPVARNRMLKKYAKWDAEIAASKSR